MIFIFSFFPSSSNHYCADAEQCKYGKNRVEADAKRLQAKEEELMKKKQEIRNHLTQLKKERRDLRTAVEAAAGERRGPTAECQLVIELSCVGNVGGRKYWAWNKLSDTL